MMIIYYIIIDRREMQESRRKKIKRIRHTLHKKTGDETESSKERRRTKRNKKKSASSSLLTVSFCFVNLSRRVRHCLQTFFQFIIKTVRQTRLYIRVSQSSSSTFLIKNYPLRKKASVYFVAFFKQTDRETINLPLYFFFKCKNNVLPI